MGQGDRSEHEHRRVQESEGRPGRGHLCHAGRQDLLLRSRGRRGDPRSDQGRRAHKGQRDGRSARLSDTVLRPGHRHGGRRNGQDRHAHIQPDRSERAALHQRPRRVRHAPLVCVRLRAHRGQRDRHLHLGGRERPALHHHAQHQLQRRGRHAVHQPCDRPLLVFLRRDHPPRHGELRGRLQPLCVLHRQLGTSDLP